MISKSDEKYLEIRYMAEKVLVVLLSPIIAIILLFALLYAKIILKEKIIFRQLRPGKNCLPFVMYKIRTMDDNGKIVPQLKFFRSFRIDEVPQFWNILKGEMSLIGPRPDAYIYLYDILADNPDYRKRYMVKPGLTGLAQVRFKHTLSVDEARKKFELDCQYLSKVRYYDFPILLGTIRKLILVEKDC